ncbi:unnamed protein product [Calypogeia fissa]
MQMANNDKFVTLVKVKIDDIWPLGVGTFVYKGCSVLLSDGRPCALGKNRRRLRRQDSESPLGPHARGRSSHVCVDDGEGTHMFCFSIQIGDNVLQVNEDSGVKLMGMSGQQFKDMVECDPAEVQSVCDAVRSVVWTIGFVKDDRDICKVISVHRHPDVKLGHPDVKLEGEDAKSVSSQVLLSPAQKDSLGRKLCNAALDFTRDIVESLKSFRIRSSD